VGGICGTRKVERKVYRVLMGKLEGNRPLGRRRLRFPSDHNESYGVWLEGVVDPVGSG
jgi:hypothetical protein